MNNQYLQTTHGKLRYWESPGTGTPLVLIPGFGASLEIWKNNFAALGKKHTVYAIEPIGAGKSDKPIIQYDLTTLATSVKEFLDAKGIQKIVLMGSSLGGAISMAFTTRFPDMVEKLILVGSAGFSRHLPFSFRILALPWIGKFLLGFSKREGVKKVLQSFVYNPAAITDEMANTAFDISQLPRQKEVMLNILRTQANIFGVKKNIFEHEFKRIQEIKIPILLIWGKQDPVIRFSDSEIALKMLPQAKLYTFDPCGHLPQIEYIDEFNQVVDGFCSNTNQASIVSLEDFNSLQETSYLLKNSNNAKRLYAAVDETEALIAKSTKKRKNRESCLYRTSKKRPTILAKK